MTRDPEMAPLLGVIDRLEELLEASELAEIEVEAGGTTLILRKPVAVTAADSAPGDMAALQALPGMAAAAAAATGASPAAESRYHAVVAPLTGVFYDSPSPGAAVYVREGGSVSTGQVIGLIEAMKLFNEIKSDITGTVRRKVADSGALVKAKQTLIEVEPS